jgi:tetratricopeptide (TPR) repeat protein
MPYRRFLLIIFIVLLWGCSTKKNTWLSRNYHDLTAHYNVFFNGNESYKAGIKAIEESHKDNFNDILPMFQESDEQAANTASSNMDRAIEKGTKLIVRHSITARPKKKYGSTKNKEFYNKKEYNKWVDDALLLIGKAQIVKHDFRQAIRTLNLLINDFPNDKNKYYALIWKARAYTELGDYNNARIALESYDLDGKAPESLYGEYMEVYADLLLRQGKYREAQTALQNAIGGLSKRADKARYSFILAQIDELTGNKPAAANAYAEALKYRPGYEMAFNAKLRRAAIVYKDASLD